MIIKFLIILVLLTVLFRWAIGKWPWDLAKGADSHKQKLAKARRVLSVGKTADKAEILAAYKLAMTRAHPDRGGSSAKVHEVTEARDLLLAELGVPPEIASDKDEKRD